MGTRMCSAAAVAVLAIAPGQALAEGSSGGLAAPVRAQGGLSGGVVNDRYVQGGLSGGVVNDRYAQGGLSGGVVNDRYAQGGLSGGVVPDVRAMAAGGPAPWTLAAAVAALLELAGGSGPRA